MKNVAPAIFAGLTLALAVAAPARADILWSMDPIRKTSGLPSNSTVATTVAENVEAPDAYAYAASATGLAAPDTNAQGAGNIYIRHSDLRTKLSLDFTTGYTEFTISATTENLLDLAELSWLSCRGGDGGTRGFQVFGAVGRDPTPSDWLLTVENELGTRVAPVRRSIDLTGQAYQGIESITFRYYALTSGNPLTIELADMQLTGAVVPEPASMGVLIIGAVALLRRR